MKKRFQNILLIVTLFFLLIFYTLLQPRISNSIPFIREYRMRSFINNSVKNNAISAKEFWQLREFYSPGTITFYNHILEYESQRSTSREILVRDTDDLQTHIQPMKDYSIVFQKANELIAKKDGVLYVFFIKPITEMKKVNGFFDYEDKDKILLQKKAWFVTAQFSK